MSPRILLVNPPIYDYTAYDYWAKPYGLLRVAGHLRGRADLALLDFMDRLHPDMGAARKGCADPWGRGRFRSCHIPAPAPLAQIPRRYRRFGLPRRLLGAALEGRPPVDVALVQTVMTYWYPGVREVVDEIRRISPGTRIVLGGVYATICPEHAGGLGADLVVVGSDLAPLWELLGLGGQEQALPFWEGYERLETGVLKLTEGCPFQCTYCSVPRIYPSFSGNVERALAELEFLGRLGVQRIALYDDALLFRAEELLLPFLEEVIRRGHNLELHTPNALNARFITPELARLMVRAGFRSFYLGLESTSDEWQRDTGGKLGAEDLSRAVEHLARAGVERHRITAYLIMAHPRADQQQVEGSMRYAHELGIRLMLCEFSPIPGTPDGEACRRWVDLDEPLWHNKTVFPLVSQGRERVDHLKTLCRRLNESLPGPSKR